MLNSVLCGWLFPSQCMRVEFYGGVVVVANRWAESRWRLRMLCDLPQRFERCCSADLESDCRMFDGLQACIIVIVGARGGSRSGRDTGCEWTRGWVSCSVLEGGDRCYSAIRRHTRCQLMRLSRARAPRRRTVRTARDLDEAEWRRWSAGAEGILLNDAENAACLRPADGKHDAVQKW